MPTSRAPIRLREPLDLLGALPHLLGFVPAESLVLLCLDEDGGTSLTVRADLPAEGDTATYAAELASHASRAGARAVALVVYTDAPATTYDLHTWTPSPLTALPRRHLVAELTRALDEATCPVGVALLVHRGTYANYLCAESCCPADGSPLSRTLTSAAGHVAAETVLEGRVVHRDRSALAARVQPHPARPAEGAPSRGAPPDEAVFERVDDEVTAAWLADGLEGSRVVTCGLVAWAVCRRLAAGDPATAAYATRWSSARASTAGWVEGDELSSAGVARIAVGLHDKQARDLVATQGLDVPPGVLVDVLCDIARVTPDRFAAPVCTLTAWLAYLSGDGALANVALDRALGCRPDYEMAHLLVHALRSQLAPSVIREMLADTRRQLEASVSSGASGPRGSAGSGSVSGSGSGSSGRSASRQRAGGHRGTVGGQRSG